MSDNLLIDLEISYQERIPLILSCPYHSHVLKNVSKPQTSHERWIGVKMPCLAFPLFGTGPGIESNQMRQISLSLKSCSLSATAWIKTINKVLIHLMYWSGHRNRIKILPINDRSCTKPRFTCQLLLYLFIRQGVIIQKCNSVRISLMAQWSVVSTYKLSTPGVTFSIYCKFC